MAREIAGQARSLTKQRSQLTGFVGLFLAQVRHFHRIALEVIKLLGHSERRSLYGEDDAIINKKVHATLAADLKPILCIGESLEERESGQLESVLTTQLEGSLANVTTEQMADVVIAYEPVWAIGTGVTATPEQAQDTQAFVRSVLANVFGEEVAAATRIQYGGSVKPGNAADLIGREDIDGFLVGGASLDPQSFAEIVSAGIGG